MKTVVAAAAAVCLLSTTSCRGFATSRLVSDGRSGFFPSPMTARRRVPLSSSEDQFSAISLLSSPNEGDSSSNGEASGVDRNDESLSSPSFSTSDLHKSLRERADELNRGVGWRYVCRTQRGFLNVHREPGDPFETTNVVNRLTEGQIVTSTEPPRGGWIAHDGGGWSVEEYGGFTWLEALDE